MSDQTPYPHLFRPIALGPLVLPNRLIMGSMHTGLEEAGDWARTAAYYARRAAGGVGLIVTGGMAPNRAGAVHPGAAGLFGPADVAAHARVTRAVRDAGGRIAMQILHAGRYAYGPDCVAPSALKAPIAPHRPQALSEAGITATIADFATAAARAREAGYDAVEVMGSEGYLINQFLAPATNRRTDDWGGNRAGRMRFALAVVKAIRQAVGADFPILYRISVLDLVPGGQSWADVAALAKGLEQAGVAALGTGIGWHEARIPTIAAPVPRGAFAWATAKLKGATGLPVIAANRINTPETAEAILAAGQADLVSAARPLLADPDFADKARTGRAAAITPCIACNQACLDHVFAMKIASCLVNPQAAHETTLVYAPTPSPRRIAVVGAGPAGISAALVAAGRGHHVTLFEKEVAIGGQMRLAARIPGKAEFRGLIAHYEGQIAAAGIALRLGVRAEPADLAGFDAVVVATGVTPRDPALPGQATGPAMDYATALSGAPIPEGPVAVLGAGGIGVDVATWLTDPGDGAEDDPDAFARQWGIADPATAPGGLAPGGAAFAAAPRAVTLMQRRQGRIGRGPGRTTGWVHQRTLVARGVRMLSGVRYRAITPAGVAIETEAGPALIAAAAIILCTGQEPERRLVAALQGTGPEVHVIGGADRAEGIDAQRAIDQGARLAARL